nr:cold-regulated 47 [Tanacetum cinerariifolium]
MSRRRWILSRGLKLVVTKCLPSTEYLTILGKAIGRAVDKGMQDGLVSGIEHGKAGRLLVISEEYFF